MPGKALLLVDVQNDFCPGGALAVRGGDEVVPVLNRYIAAFQGRGAPVYASRDWHPPGSSHFKDFGGPWPVHCVRSTAGAAFHPGLLLPKDTVVITKGAGPGEDGYSAFEGMDPGGRLLGDVLAEEGVEELYLGGLATDYCVKSTCLDALRCGFRVYVFIDAVRGVNVHPDDSAKALHEMTVRGAVPLDFSEFTLIWMRAS